jgi:subtilisin family serine protease
MPTPRPLHSTVAAMLLIGLGLLSASCARRAPNAPAAGATPHAPPAQGNYINDVDSTTVSLLIAGANAYQVADDHGATLMGWSGDLCAMQSHAGMTPAELAADLLQDSRVLQAEPDARAESPEARQESFSFDDGYGNSGTWVEQPATTAVHLDGAHTVSRGEGVTVAVLDTGIDPSHPAFAGRLVGGWDFLDHDADPTDVANGIDDDGDGQIDESFGHGTHVAGIVAVAAPDARIMALRVLDSDGRGDILSVAAGLRWAINHGARIVNLSLGMLHASEIIQHLLEEAEGRGILCVASAGNWGSDTPAEFPATSSHASAVAAVDAWARPAPFTSYGSFVALSAPGVSVRSAYPGGAWRVWSGTSMSCPFVAGTAALVFALHPDWTPDQVRDRIRATCRPLKGVAEANRFLYGQGALDAAAAVGGPAFPPVPSPEPPESQPVLRRP